MSQRKNIILHPLFFAIYPILFMLVYNLAKVSLSDITRPLSITVGFSIFLFMGLVLVLKDSRKAALVVTIFIIIFFSYGHLFEFIRGIKIGGTIIGRNRYLLPVYAFLGLAGILWTLKTRRDLTILTRILNFSGGTLVLLVLINLVIQLIKIPKFSPGETTGMGNEFKLSTMESGKTFPDIYYIILDMYARTDILSVLYHYDNSRFIDTLGELGFYVAEESVTNYPQTCLSLPSSLNFEYFPEGKPESKYYGIQYKIKHNKIFKLMKSLDYTVICFASGYAETEIKNADVYLRSRYDLNEIENMLTGSTLLRISPYLQNEASRQRTLYIFDQLGEIPRNIPSPKFVFAHILPPHYPYIFDRNGNPLNQLIVSIKSEFNSEKYIDQLIFVNKKVVEALKKIISRSPTPPIIILQSDHGPDSMRNPPPSCGLWDKPSELFIRERISILNAYYLPDGGEKHLYKSITPVNTFRLVLNHYFGSDYEMLKDVSYWLYFPDGYEKPLHLVPIEKKYLQGILQPSRIPSEDIRVIFE